MHNTHKFIIFKRVLDEVDVPSDHDFKTSTGVSLSGGRVVELNILDLYLRKGCSICEEVLNLASCFGESS